LDFLPPGTAQEQFRLRIITQNFWKMTEFLRKD
jgi:hypothetical protein